MVIFRKKLLSGNFFPILFVYRLLYILGGAIPLPYLHLFVLMEKGTTKIDFCNPLRTGPTNATASTSTYIISDEGSEVLSFPIDGFFFLNLNFSLFGLSHRTNY